MLYDSCVAENTSSTTIRGVICDSILSGGHVTATYGRDFQCGHFLNSDLRISTEIIAPFSWEAIVRTSHVYRSEIDDSVVRMMPLHRRRMTVRVVRSSRSVIRVVDPF